VAKEGKLPWHKVHVVVGNFVTFLRFRSTTVVLEETINPSSF
jgi:hypothetical protein